MTDNRWERIWQIFRTVRKAPPDEQRAIMDAECHGDESVRKDVQELLAHDRPSDRRAGEPAHDSPSTSRVMAHGDTIAQYRILDKLGEGGMGVVYRAHDIRLERPVALKFLSAGRDQDPTAAERQLREARAAAALNHPNIGTIYEIGESETGGFIAMEFIDGDLLRDRVRGAEISPELALDWAIQLCEAIGAAHDLGIIHRDIKSSNIMITRDGRLKVLDFGIALREFDTSRVTEPGMVVGTIDYLAPELLRGEAVTAASDVFSIGVVAHEILTGQRPFRGTSPAQVIYQIVNADPPNLTDVREDVSPPLAKVIQQALAKDPADRYESAGQLLTALKSTTLGPAGGTTRNVPGNLPVTTTAFIGRERDLVALGERLEEHRIVTVTGPGGAGKTRMSIELGERMRDRFPAGVFLIELAPLTGPAQVIRTIARVLGVREEPERELIDSVVAHLADHRSALLILDNCEHLIDASARTARTILESVPDLVILATSQQRLGVPGEAIWQISNLSLPREDATEPDDLRSSEAAQLFVVRASQAKSDFRLTSENAATVAQICRRLDGIALAIELAAVRVSVLPLEQILNRLEDRFRLLTGGSRTSLPRQQTLRAAVEWSIDLLTEVERNVFLTLSVFTDGLTLEAAEHVCRDPGGDDSTLDIVGRLVDKSLVMARDTSGGALRYYLLETLREYGSEALRDTGDEPSVRRRHAEFFLTLVEEAEPELTGPDQARWFHLLDAEAANVEAAVRSLITDGAPEEALRIAAAAWRFWFVRGYLGAGRELLGLCLAAAEGPPEPRARALHGAGVLANDQGDHDAAREHFEACLEIRRALDDRAGEARTLNNLGVAARDRGEFARAHGLLADGLAINRELDDRPGTAASLHALGITTHREGDCATARKLFEEGLEIRRGLGDRRGIAALLAHLGSVEHDLGNYEEAKLLLEDAIVIFRELENKRGIVFALLCLGDVAQKQGNIDAAWIDYVQGLTISRGLGDKRHLVQSLEGLTRLAAARGDHAWALELEAAASSLREQFRISRTPTENDALRDHLESSRSALGEAEADRCQDRGRSHSVESIIPLALQRS